MRCCITIFSKFKYFFILYFKIIHKQLPEIVYQSLKNTVILVISGFETDFLTFLQIIRGNKNCLYGMVVFSLTSPASLLTQFYRLGCTACPNKGCATFTVQNVHSYCNHSAHCLSDTTYYGNVLRNVYWYLNHQEEWPTCKCYGICFKCSTFNCLEEGFDWLITIKECLCKI